MWSTWEAYQKVETKKLCKHLTCRCYPLWFPGNWMLGTITTDLWPSLNLCVGPSQWWRGKSVPNTKLPSCIHGVLSHAYWDRSCFIIWLVSSSCWFLRFCPHWLLYAWDQATTGWCRFSVTGFFVFTPHALGISWRQNPALDRSDSMIEPLMMS